MPNEKQIRDLAVETLGTQGWICWWPGRIKYRAAQDIFTMWDLIAAKGPDVRFVQFTTKGHKSDHLSKIAAYRGLYGLSHPGELWLWDAKKREFDIIFL